MAAWESEKWKIQIFLSFLLACMVCFWCFYSFAKCFYCVWFRCLSNIKNILPLRCIKHRDFKISHSTKSGLCHMGKRKMGNASKGYLILQFSNQSVSWTLTFVDQFHVFANLSGGILPYFSRFNSVWNINIV